VTAPASPINLTAHTSNTDLGATKREMAHNKGAVWLLKLVAASVLTNPLPCHIIKLHYFADAEFEIAIFLLAY
jgi:hypothetical protein